MDYKNMLEKSNNTIDKALAQKKISKLLKLRPKADDSTKNQIDNDINRLKDAVKNKKLGLYKFFLDNVKNDIKDVKHYIDMLGLLKANNPHFSKKELQGMYQKLDKVVTKALNGIKNDKKHGVESMKKLCDRVSAVMNTNKKIEDKTNPGGDGIYNLNMHLIKIFNESEYAPKMVTESDGTYEPTYKPIWTNHNLYGCLSIFKECVVTPLIIDPIKNADNF